MAPDAPIIFCFRGRNFCIFFDFFRFLFVFFRRFYRFLFSSGHRDKNGVENISGFRFDVLPRAVHFDDGTVVTMNIPHNASSFKWHWDRSLFVDCLSLHIPNRKFRLRRVIPLSFVKRAAEFRDKLARYGATAILTGGSLLGTSTTSIKLRSKELSMRGDAVALDLDARIVPYSVPYFTVLSLVRSGQYGFPYRIMVVPYRIMGFKWHCERILFVDCLSLHIPNRKFRLRRVIPLSFVRRAAEFRDKLARYGSRTTMR